MWVFLLNPWPAPIYMYVCNQDGIVFTVAINAETQLMDDGSPAHPDDLERFAPWRAMFEKTAQGYKIKKCTLFFLL
jgi:hypothetical protein